MQRYLSKNELKDYLGVSLGTINNKLKELPHIKWGDNRNARVLFPVVEIEKYFGNISDKVKRSWVMNQLLETLNYESDKEKIRYL